MKSFVRVFSNVLPLLAAVGLVVAATIFTYQLISGTVTDRQILEWTFLLLTGFVMTVLVEQVAERVGRRVTLDEELKKQLRLYDEILESGIQNPDLGTQRVEKTLDRTLAARSSVFKSGIAFSNLLATENLGMWTEVLKRCQVRLILLDPDWLEQRPDVLDAIAMHLDRSPKIFVAQIHNSINNLRSFYQSLPDNYKDKLKVRLHQGYPTINFDLIDQNSPSATLMIEILPYQCGFRNRPHLILRPASSGWYESLLSRLELQWDAAKELNLGANS